MPTQERESIKNLEKVWLAKNVWHCRKDLAF